MLIRLLNYFRSFNAVTFTKLKEQRNIYLYAGDITAHTRNGSIPFIGLSITRSDRRHIKHDVRLKIPLPDNSVLIYQSEDVFEHVEYDKVMPMMNEIFRVLKPGGLFRLSLPDYQCDVLDTRCEKNEAGEIIFDRGGGGSFCDGEVVDGGHLWFPTYQKIAALMDKSDFKKNGKIEYLHYYDENSNSITKKIDHSKGIVSRTPDFDRRVRTPWRAMSIVIDAYKFEKG